MASRIIPPGSTIGVLGGGQLGRMFAMAARRLGYRVHTLAPEGDTPAGQVADAHILAPYDDVDRVRDFARRVDVVTFEFENVPAASVAAAESVALVRPNGRALAIAQHRIREKAFLRSRGIPVGAYADVRHADDLAEAVARVGAPAVLKTAAFGYDGKGQVPIRAGDDAAQAWASIGGQEAVLEAFVDLDCEISVIGARAADGSTAFFQPFRNSHRDHILDVTVTPAGVPQALAGQALDITRDVLDGLQYVGVLCIEFFVARDGRLLVNEIAPRPHNSGHLTIEACRTSQFEQQVRAVCGYPLGSAELLQPAAMVNLLGDLWSPGEPDWAGALAVPGASLHLYGKGTARPGRKMGHITVLAPEPEEAIARARAARDALRRSG